MENLKAAKAELRAAKRSIDAMKSEQDFEIFEEEWRDFLNCIEQLWNKVERSCQHKRSQFEPWQGQFKKLRKKDMLLRYLKQARHAHNHSIQEVAEPKAASRSINFANGTGGYIKNLTMVGGNIVNYQGDPLEVIDRPNRYAAVKVKNDGKWYNPPTSHLGNRFISDSALDIAIAGLEFYENYIKQVEEKFFNE
ncbi:hypothetical protein A15D_02509 [Alcanivorax sp. MD8A]|uniref:hypothetical protein n=1 Tax=Alcanivorax sp. MD8A TaxID=1177157 RepID=UPI000C9B222C|nr:hypothetical protein [Alcanivorax sp. MD8A]PNE01911.1 hypothetical protein A15D_02509 [Alcanivorax sp. MD8A]